MRTLLLALSLAAGPALGQSGDLAWELDADLDGDGAAERYRLLDNGAGTVDLSVETASGVRVAEAVAWTGGMAGQEPSLGLSPAGSLLLTSRNDSVGRDRWTLTLTIAHRGGDLRIAGITYDWRDTLDPEAGFGGCDLNLLSGRGAAFGPAGERDIAVTVPAPSLWEWREAVLPAVLPAECFG